MLGVLCGEVVFFCFWSCKGGVGTTVSAVGCATALANDGIDVLMIDFAGDVDAVFGVPVTKPGISDWLGQSGEIETLPRLAEHVAAGISLITQGEASDSAPPEDHVDVLCAALRNEPRHVVCDLGTSHFGSAGAGLAAALIDACDRSVLVTTGCYLALRRMARVDRRVDAICFVDEPGRALGPEDAARVVGAPVLATVTHDRSIARSVDAGVIAGRWPRRHLRLMQGLVS